MSGECDDCGEHTLECRCKMSQWIRVEDGIPVDEETILFALYTGHEPYVAMGFRQDGEWNDFFDDSTYSNEHVIFWLPIPILPNIV